MIEALDSGLINQGLKIVEHTALAASEYRGRGNNTAADRAAVETMRSQMNLIRMNGRIVIGEGERDEAPMLYVGESVGLGEGDEIDIAVDPLEGTSLTAKAMPGALVVMAFSNRGGLLHAPDTYMDKIAIGPSYPDGIIDLDAKPEENIKALAKEKGVLTSEIGVCVLDRSRHEHMISSIRKTGARIYLISDGDVAGAINTAQNETGIDLYMGRGGAPEGVLAAAALKAIGGQMQARLHFRNDKEYKRADKAGIKDYKHKYVLDELASGPTVFFASGVTSSSFLKGVHIDHQASFVHSLILTSWDGISRKIETVFPNKARIKA